MGRDGDVGGVGHVWDHGIRGHHRHRSRPPDRDLPPRGRSRRVGHAGRRRRGQGPDGRRASTSSASGPVSPTSRLRRTSWRRPWWPCRTRATTTTRRPAGLPELREAIAAKTRRDSGYEVERLPGARDQRRQAGRGRRRSPSLCDPGDEVLVPAPYWTTYPEAIGAGRWRAGGGAIRRVDRLPGLGRGSRGAPHRRGPRCSSSSPRPTRPAPSTPGAEIEAIGRWAARARPLGRRPTRSTSTWSTATPGTTRCRCSCRSWPTAASSSTAWPRPTP